MKKLGMIGVVLALTGCGGGYDDMDASRVGGGIGNTVTQPTNPSDPNQETTRWQYASTSNSSGIFSLRASNYALNFFYDPNFPTVKNTPWVQLEKRQSSSGAVVDTVTIFVNATLSCTPSCSVPMTFDGNRANYQMRNDIDGVIVPLNELTKNQLFNKFTTSNSAIVSLPIVGLSGPFDANFDLRGYDVNRMTF